MATGFDADRRRAELAEAVGRVLVRDGIGAVSLRSVAAEAGVALGSLRYVFPTRTDLVVGAAEHMLAQSRSRLAAVRRGRSARSYAEEVARSLLPLTERTRADLEINVALIAESRAVPGLRAVRDEVKAGVREGAEGIVRLLRSDPPAAGPLTGHEHRAAVRLHALLDGFAIDLLHYEETGPAWDARAAEAWVVLAEELDRIAAGPGTPTPPAPRSEG
ncbi:TetR/AcrR family transcriptional regulator [Micrococcus endophyticus]|uniref:TetR/AcrR family transcriptional regulator n=1 Tax=Micrococcus endophyticus TaxID=455343 RepID=UPI0034CDB2EA